MGRVARPGVRNGRTKRSFAVNAVSLALSGLVLFSVGIYGGSKLPVLIRYIGALIHPAIETDRFGRLPRLSRQGRHRLSGAGRRHRRAAGDRTIQRGELPRSAVSSRRRPGGELQPGTRYRAASPLLGADGRMGESWTLLGNKLIRAGHARPVILIPAAAGGLAVRRWAAGGDLNGMLMAVLRDAAVHYTITGVLWYQGAEDSVQQTSEPQYHADLASPIATLRAAGVTAPFFITRCSVGGKKWTADNPVARAQALLADGKTVFAGPDTDRDVTEIDRDDGYHFGASGQEKFTVSRVKLLQN